MDSVSGHSRNKFLCFYELASHRLCFPDEDAHSSIMIEFRDSVSLHHQLKVESISMNEEGIISNIRHGATGWF